jgi:hypothetical protein
MTDKTNKKRGPQNLNVPGVEVVALGQKGLLKESKINSPLQARTRSIAKPDPLKVFYSHHIYLQ